MTHEEFQQKVSDLPNSKLVQLCEQLITDLCKSGGRKFTMTVPPQITDSDILLSELIKRFKHITL